MKRLSVECVATYVKSFQCDHRFSFHSTIIITGDVYNIQCIISWLLLKTGNYKMIFKKFVISKKGIGIKSQKICKQVRDQRNGAQVLLKNENKS